MIVALVIAGAIVAGFDWRIVAVAGLVAVQPVSVIALAAAWAAVAAFRRWRRTAVDPADEAAFFGALAAELRAGASLRVALAEAAARVPDLATTEIVRRATAGLPLDTLGPLVEAAFPANGRVAAPAFALAGMTGARAAGLFETLAARAGHASELRRERRALTAQARLSALVVGVAPLLFALLLLGGGRGAALFQHGFAGYAVLGAGLGLEVLGLAIVFVMLRRAR